MLPAPEPPSADTSEQAQAALSALRGVRKTQAVTLGVRGAVRSVSVSVPAEAFVIFLEVLSQMASGNAVPLLASGAELTTQQAADFLNVSRPFLVNLLDTGKIPFRRVGRHRRVLARDLATYKQREDARRTAFADELVAEAEELGLGY